MSSPAVPSSRLHPLPLALVACAALLAAAWLPAWPLTGGRLIYTLDDPYIHLAVARNWVEHGVWGITRHGFTSSVSSILWPLLLALVYRVTGLLETAPLLLNVLAGAGLLAALDVRLKRFGLPPRARLVSLLALVFVLPLPILITMGMEHIVQALLGVLFLGAAVELALAPRALPRLVATTCLWAALLTATRYEGLFLVAGACLLLAWRRRWLLAVALAVVAWLPATLYGLWSMEHGWFFLPNSLLLKSQVVATGNGLLAQLHALAGKLAINKKVVPLLLPLALLFAWRWRALARSVPRGGWRARLDALLSDTPWAWLALATFTLLIQLVLGRTATFYRYEAWLVALLIPAAIAALRPDLAEFRLALADHHQPLLTRLTVLGILLSGAGFALRGIDGYRHTAVASRNIYEQQYQMARFIGQNYAGRTVALNDIGAVNFFTDVHCIDLYGLASREVLRAKRAGRYDRAALERVVKDGGAEMAVIYHTWFVHQIPQSWAYVGAWEIEDNVTCGDDLVVFYAPRGEAAQELRRKLDAFAPSLPRHVFYFSDVFDGKPVEIRS